jgi:hypothetical protein
MELSNRLFDFPACQISGATPAALDAFEHALHSISLLLREYQHRAQGPTSSEHPTKGKESNMERPSRTE